MKFIAIAIFCLIIPLLYSQGENIEFSEQAGHEIIKRSPSTTCYYTKQLTRVVRKIGSATTSYGYTYRYRKCWTGLRLFCSTKYRSGTRYKTVYNAYYTLETYTSNVYYSCYNGGTCRGISTKSTQCTCPKGWVGQSCDSAYPTITSAVAESLGTFVNPSPYKFTCKISYAPLSRITLTVRGINYAVYGVREMSRTLDLEHVTAGRYQFTCYTYNTEGSDRTSATYTIRERIPAPFTQFDYLPQAGEGCNTFQITKCVDAIFLVDVSSLTDLQLDRIANIGGSLPISTAACENKYGVIVFGVQNVANTISIANNSLFEGRAELKSAILTSKNITQYEPSDGYAAIYKAISEYRSKFRSISQRKIIIFTKKPLQSSTNNTDEYTFENTIALLADNNIELSVVTNAGSIYHYTETPANRLIGMNFKKHIGFGNFSNSKSSDIDLNVVPNPHYEVTNTNAYENYVTLAWDTNGSAFDIGYFDSPNILYSHSIISKLFSFAVLQSPSCQFSVDTNFNFKRRTISSHLSIWTDIQPQLHLDCVDMVFLIDKSRSMSTYRSLILETTKRLPENGYTCNNRYGLVALESSGYIFYVGGGSNKFGTPYQLYNALRSISLTGSTVDGYVGINKIIDTFSFRGNSDVRKHIVLFTDGNRDISDSSLTDATILNALRDNNIILSVVTNGATFYSLNTRRKLVAVAPALRNKVGFRTSGSLQWKVEASSGVNTVIRSSTTYSDYTEIAWKTGGIAFYLDYFSYSSTNLQTVIPIFNTLMFSWGTYVPIQIISLTSNIISQYVHVYCTTNKVPGVSISLILDGQRYQATDVNSFNVSIPLSIWNGTSPNCICVVKNSIGGDMELIDLAIKIPRKAPHNLSLTPQSSSEILAEWNDPPDHETEGIPLKYRISYQGILFDTNLKFVTTSEKRIVLSQLKPYTMYRVFIQSLTTLSISNQSESDMARTRPDAPEQSPQNVSGHAYNATAILISWYPPPSLSQNGIITTYRITIQGSPFDTDVNVISVSVTTPVYPLVTGDNYLFTHLYPYNEYTISVTAVNSVGESISNENARITTLQSGPEQSPQNVSAYAYNAKAILVSWYPPPSISQNGIITTYRITIQGSRFDTDVNVISVSVTTPVYPLVTRDNYLITDLHPYNEYAISVTAVNSVGESINSENARITTLQSAPTQSPQNALAIILDSTSVFLHWYPPTPLQQHGVIRSYKIIYHPTSEEFPVEIQFLVDSSESFPLVTSSYLRIDNLQQYTNYTFSIYAINDGGSSPGIIVIGQTDVAVEPEIKVPAEDTFFVITSTAQLLSFSLTQACTSTGLPEPTVSWMSNTNVAFSGNTLEILAGDLRTDNNINPYIFTCIAKNIAGEDSKVIRITIDIDVNKIIDGKESITDADVSEVTKLISVNNMGVNISSDNKSAVQDSIDNSAENLEKLINRYIDNNTIDESNREVIENLFIPASEIIQKDVELSSRRDESNFATPREGEVIAASTALQKTLNSVETLVSNFLSNIDTMENKTRSVVISSANITFVAEHIILSKHNTNNSNTSDITIPDLANIQNSPFTERIQIPHVVANILSQNNNTLRIATTIVRNDRMGTDTQSSAPSLFSNFISVVVPESKGRMINLPKPIKLSIPVPQSNPPKQNQICSFLRQSLWSTQGLSTTSTDNNLTYCYTNHFTSFAVFVTPRELDGSEDLKRIASIVSYALVSISFIFLIISLILFLLSAKTFFKVEANIVYFNYALAMTLAFGLFLFGIEAGTMHETLCMVIAFLLHYIWLAVFVWTLCNGILILYKLTIGILQQRNIYPLLIVFGWISPIIIPIITIAMKHGNYVNSNEHCFLTYEDGLVWAFIAPIIIILLINMIILFIAAIRIGTTKFGSDKLNEKQALRKGLISALILTPLLGIPWLLLLLNIFISSPIVQWSFIIVNGLMGVFFFVAVTLRNAEVKKLCVKVTKDPFHTSSASDGKSSNMFSRKYKRAVSKDSNEPISSPPAISPNKKGAYFALEPVSTIQEPDIPKALQSPSEKGSFRYEDTTPKPENFSKPRKLQRTSSPVDSPDEGEELSCYYTPMDLKPASPPINEFLREDSPIYEVIPEDLPANPEDISDSEPKQIVSEEKTYQNLADSSCVDGAV